MENESSDETAPADSVTNNSSLTAEADEKRSVDQDQTTGQTSTVKGTERQNSTTSTGSESKTPTATSGKDRDKINILLKPVGDAPILKNKLWAVPSERLVSQITEFVKKYLKLEKNQNLFFFVNQLFAPSPDQCLRDLYECFGSDGKLVLHYSTTVAWG